MFSICAATDAIDDIWLVCTPVTCDGERQSVVVGDKIGGTHYIASPRDDFSVTYPTIRSSYIHYVPTVSTREWKLTSSLMSE